MATRLHSCQDQPSPLEYASREKSGYAVVKTTPPPWNILVGKKVATRLHSCQDLPSPLEYVSREKKWLSGYAAMQLSRPPLPLKIC